MMMMPVVEEGEVAATTIDSSIIREEEFRKNNTTTISSTTTIVSFLFFLKRKNETTTSLLLLQKQQQQANYWRLLGQQYNFKIPSSITATTIIAVLICIRYATYHSSTSSLSILQIDNNNNNNTLRQQFVLPSVTSMEDIPNNINQPASQQQQQESRSKPYTTCLQQHPTQQPNKLPGKKGACFISKQMEKVVALDPSWNYNWGLVREYDEPSNLLFIPMAWYGDDTESQFRQRIVNAQIQEQIKNHTITHIMGFNEPDHVDQANMTVAEAIERWSILQSLNVSLVSPSCAHPNSPWMIEFMKIANEKCLRVDYIGVHYYGTDDFHIFQQDMEQFYNRYQLPLFITEFAVADWHAASKNNNRYSLANVLKFAKQALPWLEQTSWIAGYSWYSFESDSKVGWTSSLLDTNSGDLTTLGKYYKSVKPDYIYGDQSIES